MKPLNKDPGLAAALGLFLQYTMLQSLIFFLRKKNPFSFKGVCNSSFFPQ